MTSSRGLKETEKIIAYLTQIDKSEEEKAAEKEAERRKQEESFEDLSLFDVSKDETTLQTDHDSSFDDFGKL